MESAAEQFILSLGSEEPLVAKPDASAVCLVNSASLKFVTDIREKIKFAVTRRSGPSQVKEKVANRQDLCGLSQDWKQFKFGFDLQSSGVYKVVVMLGDKHVKNSPLRISVAEMKRESLKPELLQETDKVSSWLQSIHLPAAESPASPPDPLVGDWASDFRSPVEKAEQGPAVQPKCCTEEISENMAKPKIKSDKERPLLVTSLIKQKPSPKLFSIKDGEGEGELKNPIGLCVLNSGTLVVASTRGDKVKLFAANGKLTSTLTLPNAKFSRPSDMTALANGNFIVRDDKGLHEFGGDGSFLRRLSAGQVERGAKCFGLAQDEEGRLATVVETRASSALLFIDLKKDVVVLKRDLVKNRVGGSKCRFLSYAKGKLYVTDLGLNKIYEVDVKSGVIGKTFGDATNGGLNDPAGVGLDEEGGLMVADSKNHRICLFSAEGSFLSNLVLSPPVKRPSGVLLDTKRRELYVLNLWGQESLVKYNLG